MPKILLIGSTCVDVIIEIDHLPKTAEDIQPKRQTLALGGCANLPEGLSEVSSLT